MRWHDLSSGRMGSWAWCTGSLGESWPGSVLRGGKRIRRVKEGAGRQMTDIILLFCWFKTSKIFQNLRDTKSLDPLVALSKQLQQPFGKQSHLAQPSPLHGWQYPGATSPCIHSITLGAQLGFTVLLFAVLFRNLMNLCLKRMLFQTEIQRK